MFINEVDDRHLYWDPIYCAEAGQMCSCGEGTHNVIYAKSKKDANQYLVDYDAKNDGFQERVTNSAVECKKVKDSDSCFCDRVVKNDLLWGPPRTFG
jgi:hypothetical protein